MLYQHLSETAIMYKTKERKVRSNLHEPHQELLQENDMAEEKSRSIFALENDPDSR